MGIGPDDANFSRGGSSNAGGKLTERIDVPVTEDLKGEVAFLAAAQRMSVSEYCREVLESHCFGEANRVRRILQDRVRVVNGENRGL